MSFSGRTRTIVFLGYKEDICLAQGLLELVFCSRTSRTGVLLKDTHDDYSDVANFWGKEF